MDSSSTRKHPHYLMKPKIIYFINLYIIIVLLLKALSKIKQAVCINFQHLGQIFAS